MYVKKSFCMGFVFFAFLLAPHLCLSQPAPVKLFWVDSYNQGYAWSDGIEQGILSALEGKHVKFGSFHMDTKQCKNSECMLNAAQNARKAIEAFAPDVLIASDDNAQKYLIVPYYKNSSLPVIFCGVNWNAANYGYPAENVTGMIEVELVKETIEHMRRFARGNRVGYISGNTASDRKIIGWLNKLFFDMKMEAVRVSDFGMFQKEFISLQQRVDMLFIRNYAGIEGWDELNAKKFIARNLTIPTGSNNDFMAPYVIFTLGKIPQEQGEYAAKTALKVAAGAQISDFPIKTNKRARMTVNLGMANAAEITLPLSILKIATIIGQETYHQTQTEQELLGKDFKGRRVCWVDSYHKGYAWSDVLEKTIKDILFETGIELKIIRMDSKRQNDETRIKQSALKIKEQIDAFSPDVLIASDDNAQKHLVVPFYKGTELPVVFCGVNRDVRPYGYPTSNVTGMIEIVPMTELISLLEPYAAGKRIGYFSGDTLTERKLFEQYKNEIYHDRIKDYIVKSMEEFKKEFIKAQKEVDILYFSNNVGIQAWNMKEAVQFINQNTKIPSGAHNAHMERLVACTLAHQPEEHGRHAAITALKILQGTSPKSIPLSTNKEFSMIINFKLAQKAGIVLPLSILKQARVINQ